MLFKIRQTDNPDYPIGISFDTGEFGLYALAVGQISDKVYDKENKCWQIKEDSLISLRQFETEDHSDLLWQKKEISENPIEISGWEDIGNTLKLAPYDYQKQVAKYVLDNEKVLITIPCGGGRD